LDLIDEIDDVTDAVELLRTRREAGESMGPDSLLVNILVSKNVASTQQTAGQVSYNFYDRLGRKKHMRVQLMEQFNWTRPDVSAGLMVCVWQNQLGF
jgi:hypothetical protein